MKKLLLLSFLPFLISSASAVKWSVNNCTNSDDYQFQEEIWSKVPAGPSHVKFVSSENTYSNPRFRIALNLHEKAKNEDEINNRLRGLPPALYLNKKEEPQNIEENSNTRIPGLTIYTTTDVAVFTKDKKPGQKIHVRSSRIAIMSKIEFPSTFDLSSNAQITLNFYGFAKPQNSEEKFPLFDVKVNFDTEERNFRHWLPNIPFDGIDHLSKLGTDLLGKIVPYLGSHMFELRPTSKKFKDISHKKENYF